MYWGALGFVVAVIVIIIGLALQNGSLWIFGIVFFVLCPISVALAVGGCCCQAGCKDKDALDSPRIVADIERGPPVTTTVSDDVASDQIPEEDDPAVGAIELSDQDANDLQDIPLDDEEQAAV